MREARAAAALAALLLAAPAAAYQRSFDPDTKKELFWPLPAVPYAVSTARPATSPGAPSCAPGAPDGALDAVRASFSEWRQQCGDRGLVDLDLVYAGTLDEIRTGLHGTSDNLVVFRRGWCSNDQQVRNDPCYSDPDVDCGNLYGCFEDHTAADRRAVAYTVTLYDPATGAIVDGDIEVNGWDGQLAGANLTTPPTNGWYFTCGDDAPTCTAYGQAGCTYMDLRNTVTHEVGHFLGLAHTAVASTTMYSLTQPGETQKRTLSPDDVAGVCAIYPKPSGCSSAGGAGVLAAVLALAAAPLTRRRSPRTPPPGACRRSPRPSGRSGPAPRASPPSRARRPASPSPG